MLHIGPLRPIAVCWDGKHWGTLENAEFFSLEQARALISDANEFCAAGLRDDFNLPLIFLKNYWTSVLHQPRDEHFERTVSAHAYVSSCIRSECLQADIICLHMCVWEFVSWYQWCEPWQWFAGAVWTTLELAFDLRGLLTATCVCVCVFEVIMNQLEYCLPASPPAIFHHIWCTLTPPCSKLP